MRNSPRSCGPDAGRGRDTIRVDFGLALLRPALAGLRRAPRTGGLVALRRSEPRGLGRSYGGFKKKSFKGAQLFGF